MRNVSSVVTAAHFIEERPSYSTGIFMCSFEAFMLSIVNVNVLETQIN